MLAYLLMADRRTSAFSQSASTSGRTMMAKSGIETNGHQGRGTLSLDSY